MTRDRVAGVVLAAGLSSRMGRNKMLLDLSGKSVVRRAAERAQEAGLSPLLVVVGHERERVEAELAGLSCTPIFNPDYAGGINTSTGAGIAAVPEDCAGALVLLADMPFVTAEMLRTLLDAFRRGEANLIVSTYGGVLAPPMLYDRSFFDELRGLSGEGCGKRVVKHHQAEAIELAWPAEALADLDVPDDIAAVARRIKDAR